MKLSSAFKSLLHPVVTLCQCHKRSRLLCFHSSLLETFALLTIKVVFFPREMYWLCSLGGFWVLGGVSKMSTVMSCRDGGRKCFMMVMVMTIAMILMAMMIPDISRYGEQVSFGSSGWNHPHIPHPVFVSSSSYFYFCLLVILFFIFVLLVPCLPLFPDDVSHLLSFCLCFFLVFQIFPLYCSPP